MAERVKVGGRFLDVIGPAVEMKDSTVLRLDGWSGDYQASCRFVPRSGSLPSFVRRGATYEHVGHGRTWGGLLSEPTPNGDGSYSLNAVGFGASLGDWMAVSGGSPTFVPNTAFDAAVSDGLPCTRWASSASPNTLSAGVVSTVEDGMTDLGRLLVANATSDGTVAYVDSFGEVSYRSAATSPQWITVPTPGYGGTADETFVTHLYGWYVTSVDGTTGEPNGWGFVVATDDEAEAQHGRRSEMIDLRDRGLLTGTAAQDAVDAMLAAKGGRLGYTVGLEFHRWNLRRLGFGTADPMGMFGLNGAGTMIRVPGSMDAGTASGSWDVLLGEVERDHTAGVVSATPFGFAPRTLPAVLSEAARDSKNAKPSIGDLLGPNHWGVSWS